MSSYFNFEWVIKYIGKKNNLVIFDVGAFDFKDSIELKKYFSDSDVYAFEAFPNNFQKYGDDAIKKGVKVFNLAISEKNGDAIFYNSTSINGREWTCSGSLLRPSEKSKEIHPTLTYNENGVIIKTIRIDEFCEKNNIINVDVIHMDIQGAEYYAVKSLGEKIRPKILFCETCEFEIYDGALTLEELDNLLISLGYEIKERLKYDTLYVLK